MAQREVTGAGRDVVVRSRVGRIGADVEQPELGRRGGARDRRAVALDRDLRLDRRQAVRPVPVTERRREGVGVGARQRVRAAAAQLDRVAQFAVRPQYGPDEPAPRARSVVGHVTDAIRTTSGQRLACPSAPAAREYSAAYEADDAKDPKTQAPMSQDLGCSLSSHQPPLKLDAVRTLPRSSARCNPRKSRATITDQLRSRTAQTSRETAPE